jgi:hypothetical protein
MSGGLTLGLPTSLPPKISIKADDSFAAPSVLALMHVDSPRVVEKMFHTRQA